MASVAKRPLQVAVIWPILQLQFMFGVVVAESHLQHITKACNVEEQLFKILTVTVNIMYQWTDFD